MKIDQLINEHKDVFDGQPWYGASIMETMNSVSFNEANIKLNSSHSIAELVKHMLNWRKFLVEKINANKDYDIEVDTSADWEENFAVKDEVDWKKLIEELSSSQEEIAQNLMQKSNDWLLQKTAGKDYNNQFLIRGAIFHDVYHLGQIRLIKSIMQRK